MFGKIYYILNGNNGATYILNAKDIEAIFSSLKFYKARTLKQKMMKSALSIYLKYLGIVCKAFSFRTLKDKSVINLYLEKLVDQSIDFELDENSSVLVSPTRDKIIVHHHGRYFHKFSFNGSYKNVKNEANIYRLLDRPLRNFEVSKLYDFIDNKNEFCSFKLSSQRKDVKVNRDLTLALVELFNVSRQDGHRFFSYLEGLKNRYVKSGIDCDLIEKIFEKLEDSHKDAIISFGLVHRDFKPWNINDEYGLLIYDFEESITNGLPLEDLLNYYVDPIIRFLSPVNIVEKIFDDVRVKEYKRYLENLEVDLDFQVFLYSYLIERVIFWINRDEKETSAKYCSLLEYIVREHLENEI